MSHLDDVEMAAAHGDHAEHLAPLPAGGVADGHLPAGTSTDPLVQPVLPPVDQKPQDIRAPLAEEDPSPRRSSPAKEEEEDMGGKAAKDASPDVLSAGTVVGVVTFQAFFWLCGITAFIIGLYLVHVDADVGDGLLNAPLPIALVVFGCVVVVLCVVAVVALIMRQTMVLLLHALLVFILLVCFIALVGVSSSYENSLPVRLRDGWVEASDPQRDVIQERYECCGFKDGTDLPGPSCQSYGSMSASDTGIASSLAGCEQQLIDSASRKLSMFSGAALFGIVLTMIDGALSVTILAALLPRWWYSRLDEGSN